MTWKWNFVIPIREGKSTLIILGNKFHRDFVPRKKPKSQWNFPLTISILGR